MDEPEFPWYGKTVILTEDVKYIGEGPDPKDDPYYRVVMDTYIEIVREAGNKKATKS